MPETYIVIDGHNIANRSYHAMGEVLSHGQMRTGMIYGFTATTLSLMDKLGTDKVIFCFDNGPSKRIGLHRGYKRSRKLKFDKLPEAERNQISVFRKQVAELRDVHLPEVGFRNVFSAEGYEADDVIASVAASLPNESQIVVVSSDHDLYQLLSGRVAIWNPHTNRIFQDSDFVKKYEVDPDDWARVKAIAGCGTDDVFGVKGVGEKKAIDFLLGRMNRDTATYRKIVDFHGSVQYGLNTKLVTLPYKGCPIFKVRRDAVDSASWRRFCDKFGIRKFRDQHPACRSRTTFGLGRTRRPSWDSERPAKK